MQMEHMMQAVKEINDASDSIGKVMDVIARYSGEQASGITQINHGIEQVAQVVQQNSATAEESAAASQEMSAQSKSLQELIGRFKIRDYYLNS